MGPHVPFVPPPFFVAEQALQVPTQAESQQTPSTQNALAHSCAPMHAAPPVFLGMQAPAAQNCPGAHCASMVHMFAHAAPMQENAPQLRVPLSTQVPMPSQVSGFVWVPLLQLPAKQTVPEA